MGKILNRSILIDSIKNMGISVGDTVLVRASLNAVGPMQDGPTTLVNAFLDVINDSGTLVSLSFTGSSFIKRPDPNKPFRPDTPTYAGAFPSIMLTHPAAKRSKHPTCSYVAIGRNADLITADHGPKSPAYEPVRKILDLSGKMALVGCVASSPGFTTVHLAEYDLGLLKRVIFPWLNAVYYEDDNGALKLFRRKDLGLCSSSFYKFYSFYVNAGILRSGQIGNAYSIVVPARAAYAIERQILSKNPMFNVCENPDCFMCNGRRWDRFHKVLPGLAKRGLRKIKRVLSK